MDSQVCSIVQQIGAQLTCSLCNSVFEDPHSLPCQHHYCGRCIDEYLEDHSQCPKCMCPFWRKDSRTNLSILNITKVYKDLLRITSNSNNKHTLVPNGNNSNTNVTKKASIKANATNSNNNANNSNHKHTVISSRTLSPLQPKVDNPMSSLFKKVPQGPESDRILQSSSSSRGSNSSNNESPHSPSLASTITKPTTFSTGTSSSAPLTNPLLSTKSSTINHLSPKLPPTSVIPSSSSTTLADVLPLPSLVTKSENIRLSQFPELDSSTPSSSDTDDEDLSQSTIESLPSKQEWELEVQRNAEQVTKLTKEVVDYFARRKLAQEAFGHTEVTTTPTSTMTTVSTTLSSPATTTSSSLASVSSPIASSALSIPLSVASSHHAETTPPNVSTIKTSATIASSSSCLPFSSLSSSLSVPSPSLCSSSTTIPSLSSSSSSVPSKYRDVTFAVPIPLKKSPLRNGSSDFASPPTKKICNVDRGLIPELRPELPIQVSDSTKILNLEKPTFSSPIKSNKIQQEESPLKGTPKLASPSLSGPILVGTTLPPDLTLQIQNACSQLGGKLVGQFTRRVTHVVCRASEPAREKKEYINSPLRHLHTNRTLKTVLGILHGKWLVSAEWIAASLQAGRWIAEDDFEIVGDTNHPFTFGPRKSRLAHKSSAPTPDVFAGYRFMIHPSPPVPPGLRDEELCQVIRAGGGTIIGTWSDGSSLGNTPTAPLRAQISTPEGSKNPSTPGTVVALRNSGTSSSCFSSCTSSTSSLSSDPIRNLAHELNRVTDIILCGPYLPCEEACKLRQASGLCPISYVWLLDCVSHYKVLDFVGGPFRYQLDLTTEELEKFAQEEEDEGDDSGTDHSVVPLQQPRSLVL